VKDGCGKCMISGKARDALAQLINVLKCQKFCIGLRQSAKR
jgi:hypothetical protein